MGNLTIVRSVADLRIQISNWRRQGQTVALVPTMGSLHDGHLSLVKTVQKKADKVCVSLFVNPKQFGPNEDFDVYPRDEGADVRQLEDVGTDLLYAPDVSEIYPEGHTTSLSVGPLADILEGECRPGFFTGVATVVSKLLLQVLPDVAIFGEKDFQQLQVIRKVVKDMNIPVDILGGATVRESDGLALSSRNTYLTKEERAVASKLHYTLQKIAHAVTINQNMENFLLEAIDGLKAAGFSAVDYLTVRDANTLQFAKDRDQPIRVLVAATLGKTRLIDNIAV